MALMNWSKDLEVNFPKVDEQHRSLLDAVNRLHDAMKAGKGKDEVGRVLHFLADYTVSHFRMEEELMASHGYPGAAAHRQIHADLLAQVGQLVSQFDSGTVTLTLKVMTFLQEWLTHHIKGEDMKLGAFLRTAVA
nr:bacteriohemerythrin [uncultured Holophaga sp.]